MIEDEWVLIFLILFCTVEAFLYILSLLRENTRHKFRVLLLLYNWRKILQSILFLSLVAVWLFKYKFFKIIVFNYKILLVSVCLVIIGVLLLFVLCFILDFLLKFLVSFTELHKEVSAPASEFTKVQKKDIQSERIEPAYYYEGFINLIGDIVCYIWNKDCITPIAVFTNSKRTIWVKFYRDYEARHALIKMYFLSAFLIGCYFLYVLTKGDKNFLILSGGLFFLIGLYGIFLAISVFYGKNDFLKRAKIWCVYCFWEAVGTLVLLVAPLGINGLFRWYFSVGAVILILQGVYQVLINRLKKRLVELYPNEILDNEYENV